MRELFESDAASFCMSVMEKLNSEDASIDNIKTVLYDLCDFFDFMHSFIYEQDYYRGTLHGHLVTKGDCLVAENLPSELDIQEPAGKMLLQQLAGQKIVHGSFEEPVTELEIAVWNAMHIKTFILLPVFGEEDQIVAVLGLGEHNYTSRMKEFKLSAAFSVLVIISNHVKVNLYIRNIERAQQALEIIGDNLGVDIYINDFKSYEVLYVNRSMAAPYGGVDAMLGELCWDVLYDDKTEACDYCPQKKLIDEAGNPTKVYSWDYRRPFDGSWFRVLSAAFPWNDGRLAHIVSSIDITDNKNKQEVLQKIAEYDTLTGISNRRKLYLDGEALIASRSENKLPFHVLFLDLNKFKQVNDNYGHRAGDELLKQIGTYLRSVKGVGEHCYRYGGDEFVILFPDQSHEEVLRLTKKLRDRFLLPWQLETCVALCPASIGIAEYPADGENVDTLFENADKAMYQSKHECESEIVVYNAKR